MNIVIQHFIIADSSIILFLYTVLLCVDYSLSVLVVPSLVIDLHQEHEQRDGLVANLCVRLFTAKLLLGYQVILE